jgi:hypothetical protein
MSVDSGMAHSSNLEHHTAFLDMLEEGLARDEVGVPSDMEGDNTMVSTR